jgi:outer membrane protein insertion porin family
MPKRLNRLVNLLIAGAFLSATGWAVTIDHIRIENLEKTVLDPSFVRAYTSLRAGQEVDDEAEFNAAVALDVDSLRRSGRFSYVRAFVEQDGEKLTLVYSVEPRLRLRDIKIVGAKGIGNRKIKDQLELKLGDYIDEAIVGEKIRKVEAYCRKNKYPDASASWTMTPDLETSAADLLVTVVEGEKLRVKKINLVGDRFLSDSRPARTGRFFEKLTPGQGDPEKAAGRFETDEVKGLLNQKKTFWITPWFGAYRPEVIDVDVATLEKFYLDHGFLDVQVASPDADNLGRGRLELTYRITEGGQYRIGTIGLEGVELFETTEIEKQIRLTPGDIASKAAINSAAAAVTRYYGNRGYLRTRVEPVIETDPVSLEAGVLFRVSEGALAHINQIEVRGNEKTRDEVIRRELAVAPGELFHQQKVETSERRLKNLGYFETVDSSYIPADGTNTYDLSFDVKEKSMGSFLIGAGFSSVDSIVGFAEVSHGNFDIKRWPPVGDGQKMKIRVQAGSERNDLEVSFVEPWFMDRKLALGVDLYQRNAGYYSDFYQLLTVGGRLSLSKPFSPFVRGTLSYSIESFDVYEVSTNAPSEIKNEEGVRTKSTLGFSISRDTRDQFFIPTRGNRSSAKVELSGGPLGGDTEIISFEAKSSHFWPLWKEHVLNIKGEVRTVESYGDGAVPIFDRLFLGGPRSLRGFEYRDVSPRSADATSDEPVGGKSSYFVSAEYTVPLWSKIRGAAFYDLGAVSPETLKFFEPAVNSSYGFGARFDLPMFPLRLDYAFPHLTDDDNEDAAPRWNFMLGYTF